MKKQSLSFACLLLSLAAFTFSACRKDKNDTAETIISAEDNSTAENEFTSLFDLADDVASNDRRVRAGSSILPSGAVLSFQDSLYSDGDGIECSIDFGPLKNSAPKGLLCMDGRFRAGKVHIVSNRPYGRDSAELIIRAADADGFYAGNDGVNMSKLTGSLTIFRLSQTSVRISVSDARAINDRGTVAWQSVRTITKLLDNGPGILGDQFEISGSASGINRNGESFTVNIDLPLLKKIEPGCARTFVKGKISLRNVSAGNSISIDYDPFSNQACDLLAKATINGREYFYTVR